MYVGHSLWVVYSSVVIMTTKILTQALGTFDILNGSTGFESVLLVHKPLDHPATAQSMP